MNPTRDNILHIDILHPDPTVIQRAASIITKGGVVVFPTRCLYGLAADALNPVAVDRVFKLKRRLADNPVLILVSRVQLLSRFVEEIPPVAERLMERFWPGRLTLLFKAAPELPANLTAGSNKIGIRLPEHAVARALVCACPSPITGTSANLSGQSGCADIRDLDPMLMEQVDLILDCGPLKGGAGSTIVDVTQTNPDVLREGEISAAEIFGTR